MRASLREERAGEKEGAEREELWGGSESGSEFLGRRRLEGEDLRA